MNSADGGTEKKHCRQNLKLLAYHGILQVLSQHHTKDLLWSTHINCQIKGNKLRDRIWGQWNAICSPCQYRLRGRRPKLVPNKEIDMTFSPALQQFGIPRYISHSCLKVVLSKIPFWPSRRWVSLSHERQESQRFRLLLHSNLVPKKLTGKKFKSVFKGSYYQTVSYARKIFNMFHYIILFEDVVCQN